MLNSDLIELLQILRKNEVKFLIVGAYAVIQYTEPRYTKDIDIWVDPSVENSEKVWIALTEFGAPLEQVNIKDFQDDNNVFQIGVEPNRIDILMGVDNLTFNNAWESSNVFEFETVQVKILDIDDLIRSKTNTGRLQDQLDIEKLKKAKFFNKNNKY